MSERRDRRRLHARARALGVPLEQARRHPAPQPRRSPAPLEPAWPRTEPPDRDEDRSGPAPVRAEDRSGPAPVREPSHCCTVTRTREVLAGGTVVMLTVHAQGCTVWAAR